MRYAIILFLLLSSCAERKVFIEPEVMMYADLWEGIYGKEITSDVRFGKLTGDTVGLCAYGEKRVITLDKEFWDEISELGREELIFHEFGHCELDLGHDKTLTVINGKNVPTSIMYPYTIGDSIYGANQNYYREELKTKRK